MLIFQGVDVIVGHCAILASLSWTFFMCFSWKFLWCLFCFFVVLHALSTCKGGPNSIYNLFELEHAGSMYDTFTYIYLHSVDLYGACTVDKPWIHPI